MQIFPHAGTDQTAPEQTEPCGAGAQYGEVFQIDENGGKMTDEIMSAITGHSAKQE